MTETVIRVTGLKELVDYLKTTTDERMPKALREAGQGVAQEVAEIVKAHIPVGRSDYPGGGPDPHPGQLRGSVSSRSELLYSMVEIGKGDAGKYARPQMFGRTGRYRHLYGPIWDDIQAVKARLATEYAAALDAAVHPEGK